jgi:hypothetical protein
MLKISLILLESLELAFIDGRLSLISMVRSTGHPLHEKALKELSLEPFSLLYKHSMKTNQIFTDELVLWLGVEHNIAISLSALHATLKTAGLTRKIFV